jgi:hypothetical protein
MLHGFLTFCCVSRSKVFAKNVSAFADNISVYLLGGRGESCDFPHILYCFISLKPASTVFPPNCHSNSRFGVAKSLWESCSTSTLKTFTFFQSCNEVQMNRPQICAHNNEIFRFWACNSFCVY